MIAFLTFIKSPLFKYLMIALAVFGFLFGIFYAGEQRIQKKWDKEKSERKVQIEIQRVVQEKITYLTNTVYVDRIKEVKIKGDTIYVKVPEYITKEDDAACTIRNGFTRVWNSALTNTIPGPADETDRADAGVSLTEVAENHTANTTTCLIYKERALAWEKWAKEQKAASEEKK